MQGRGCRSACRPWPTRWGHALPCWHRCCGAWRRMSLPPNDCTVTTRRCRCWRRARPTPGDAGVYVRDDRPFAGPDPPAAMFYYSRDRGGDHPARHLAGYAGILQADAYGGYNKLSQADRQPGPIVEATCWAHARRPFFVLADLAANARRKAQGKPASVISPLALEAVRRIDAIFAIEREIKGHSAAERLAVRQARIVPRIAELEAWMRAE